MKAKLGSLDSPSHPGSVAPVGWQDPPRASGICLPPSSCCWDQLGVDAEVFVVSAFHLPPTACVAAK